MSCLICLRNEGISLPEESTNEFQILLHLFAIPEEFAQILQGNKCCSLCKVKLQFVQVINQEMSILGEKLKCFENEVKGIFVSSFVAELNECEDVANQARKKLFNVLNISKDTHVPVIESEPEYRVFKVEPKDQPDFDFQSEQPEYSFHVAHEYPNVTVQENEDFVEEDQIPDEDQIDFEEDDEYLPKQPTSSRRSQRHKKPTKPIKEHSKRPAKKPRNYAKMRKYICTMCPTKTDFFQNEDYENHMQTAHPSRQYSTCPICTRIILEDENFSQSRFRLRIHMRVHTGIRPYSCDECGASFKRNSDLKNHKETHAEREMIECDICGRNVPGMRNLNHHFRRKHEKWNFNCQYCGLISRTEGPTMEEHLKICKKKIARK